MAAAPHIDTKEMIARLVAFDTTSWRSNLELIDWVEDYLAAHGARCRRTFDDDGRKANLFATIGPERAGGIVLSGHTDVVPVEGQHWQSEPFALTERDGRLYGRGTCDMKGFLAIALALAPEMAGAPLQRPIHLALSYDEEVGCFGVGRLIADVTANLPRPAAVIVGEPSEMRPVNAHKGVRVYRTVVRGRAAHSSQPQLGANAIIAAARIVEFIRQRAQRHRLEGPHDARFVPPYTSFQVGRIEGGTATNIVAEHCSLLWEFRPLPGDDGDAIEAGVLGFIDDEVLPELRQTAPEAAVTTERIAGVVPLAPENAGVAEALIRQLTGANEAGAVSFATEGGLFQAAGLSTIICGPGSIDQAHQPDEFIALSQVAACEAFVRRVIDWASGRPVRAS